MIGQDSLVDNLKVLFVDDEPDICQQAKIFLEEESERINVKTAPSAGKGMKELEKGDFDAVVSDYLMPRMDGLEFLQRLRDEGNDIPFIMLTGKGDEKVAMRAANMGIDRYFKKIEKGGSPKEQYKTIADSLFRIVNESEEDEENFIAWVEVEPIANIDSIKHDIRELSEKIDFTISSFKIDKAPWESGTHDVLGVYTTTCSEISKEKASIIEEWKNKVLWDTNIMDFGIMIEDEPVKDKTRTLQEEGTL